MTPGIRVHLLYALFAIVTLVGSEFTAVDPSKIRWGNVVEEGRQGEEGEDEGYGGSAVQNLLRQIQALSVGPAADPATVQDQAFAELKTAAAQGLVREDGTEVSRNTGLLPLLYESDIVLTEAQAREILREAQAFAGGGRRRRKRKLARKTGSNRWPTVIPYELSGGSEAWRRAIEVGLDAWRHTTCLTFRPAQGTQEDRLKFFQGKGCFATLGRSHTASRGQDVSIGPGCETPAIVAHEIGHALGLWHEQSRPDQDAFVTVDLSTVPKNMQFNFEVQNVETDIPYDYGSVMHYGMGAFASGDSFSLTPKDAAFRGTMGQRVSLSFLDVKTINGAYCDVCGGRGRRDCAHGGYADPKDCARCRCPSGLGGATCGAVAPSEGAQCGGELLATAEWQTVESSAAKARCHRRIRAADGGQVFVRITAAAYRRRWTDSCSAFVEWKWGSDLSQTGARFCQGALPEGKWSEGSVVVLTHDTLSDGAVTEGRFVAQFMARSSAATTTTMTTETTKASATTSTTSKPKPVARCEQTVSGRTCQRWATHPLMLLLAWPGRTCANPDKELGPWCYTEDGGQRWEFCPKDCAAATSLPRCEKTKGGLPCMAWESQSPHAHEFGYMRGKGRSCQNPSKDPGPWCYTMESGKRWEYCEADCPSDPPSKVVKMPHITGDSRTFLKPQMAVERRDGDGRVLDVGDGLPRPGQGL